MSFDNIIVFLIYVKNINDTYFKTNKVIYKNEEDSNKSKKHH
jgi:hypothetical protein